MSSKPALKNQESDGDQSADTTVVKGNFRAKSLRGLSDAKAIRRGDIFYADPFKLTVEPGWNKRNMSSDDVRKHVKELAKSMAEAVDGKPRGVLEPLRVKIEGDSMLIRSGHCRYAAVMQAINDLGAEITEVPVLPAPTDEKEAALGQFHNNSGLAFTPLERGAHYIMMRDNHGMTPQDIATSIGRTTSHVLQCVTWHDLLTPHDDIMLMINNGYARVGLVVDIMMENENDPDAALQVLRGARDIAIAAGANRVMPKHAREFIQKLYADQPAEEEETGEAAEEEVSEAANENTSTGETSAPPAGDVVAETEKPAATQPAGDDGKKTTTTKTSVATTKTPPAPPPITGVNHARDEIITDFATLSEKHKKRLYEIFGDANRGKVDRFLRGALKGEWKLPD